MYISEDSAYRIDKEITIEDLEKLKNYDTVIFEEKFNSSIDNLPDNIKNIYWNGDSEFLTEIKRFPASLEILDMENLVKENKICKLNEGIKILIIPNLVNAINIPQSVEILHLVNYENPSYNLSSLVNLKKLYLGEQESYSDEPIIQDLTCLPPNLEYLSIGLLDSFNLTNLPNGLKVLSINNNIEEFNLEYLPASLEELSIINDDYDFKTNLNSLPRNLKKLSISRDDNDNQECSISNLPESLEILELTHIYPDSLRNLPKGLKKLSIESNFDCEILNLPDSLEILILKNINLISRKVILPNGLKKLVMKYVYPSNNLEKFNYKYTDIDDEYIENLDYRNYDYEYKSENELDISNLSTHPNLINLEIDVELLGIKSRYNQELKKIFPDQLTSLKLFHQDPQLVPGIGNRYNASCMLPENLKFLSIRGQLSFKFVNIPKLEGLILDCHFTSSTYEIPELPKSLKTLYIRSIETKTPKCEFPNNLENLYLDIEPKENFKENNSLITLLPVNLKKLFIRSYFIKQIYLPENLNFLWLWPILNENPDYVDTSNPKKEKKIRKIIDNIFNNIPDSVETLLTNIEFESINILKMPKNLNELVVYTRYLILHKKDETLKSIKEALVHMNGENIKVILDNLNNSREYEEEVFVIEPNNYEYEYEYDYDYEN